MTIGRRGTDSERDWAVDPQDSGRTRTRVSPVVRDRALERDTVSLSQRVALRTREGDLECPLENIGELVALVAVGTVTAHPRLYLEQLRAEVAGIRGELRNAELVFTEFDTATFSCPRD